ncbi:MAG: hypothetical protein KJO39_11340 [Bacteroidia bacterium]|nr:hypothetical protein [Bacteroidia bacterium]NNF31674.1 hypothetical protein [Flavobacteriaceae bacterium]NNJ82223.1 hypothetical protein [Flavobacteriaceae bacterium]NNK55188.1 hypothetical protein [Flavobacteriaceae bacterium]NNM10183.1 hypothetical protein [Flavobacteriaceae bacterium]
MILSRKHIILFSVLLLLQLLFSSMIFQKLPPSDSLIMITRGELLIKNDQFIAGDPISIDYRITLADTIGKNESTYTVHLLVISAYGSSLLQGQITETGMNFVIPEEIARKSGDLDLRLIHNKRLLDSKTITITSKTNSGVIMENYLGPPSMTAGAKDFSMMVVMPTDEFDNLLPDSTLVSMREQIDETIISTDLYVVNGYAWKNIYSTEKAEKVFVSAECLGVNSKEMETKIRPSYPVDFGIFAMRTHNYADGNQIVSLSTSLIKDVFGNIIADGTVVTFTIITSDGHKLSTSGAILNGVAEAQILHPDHSVSWKIKGVISGIAESERITIEFESITRYLKVHFSKDGGKLFVGPLTSYMDQLAPDGTEVSLYTGDRFITRKSSLNGVVVFDLRQHEFELAENEITVNALGLSRTLKLKSE